jgi:hypothetical protein
MAADFNVMGAVLVSLKNTTCTTPANAFQLSTAAAAAVPSSSTDSTIISTTQATPSPAGPVDCVGQGLDLVFVVDGSGSICDNDPKFQYGKDTTCDNWNFILKFMGDFVNDMDIGLTSTRVGLVTFATTATLGWDLKKYETFSYRHCSVENYCFSHFLNSIQ